MISFIFEFVAFLAFIVICLYLPGKFLLHSLRLKVASPQELFISIGCGFLLFTLIAYIFSWLKIEILLIPFFLVLSVLAVRKNQWKISKIKREHFIPLLIVAILAILFSTSMIVTGKYGDTIVYRHDDIWHLALINELKAHFPPENPAFAGVPMKGYHFFYNFIIAKISNLFFISPLSLHFHLFPLFAAFLWGGGVYSLMLTWSKKISAAVWAVFLTMFGGSLAFILVLEGHPRISLDSGLGISQPAIALYNPPFATSVLVIIIALFAFYNYLTTKQKTWLVPIVMCVGLVAMFKVYAGMLLMGALLLLVLFSLVQKRWSILIALFAVGSIFFLTYQQFNANAGYLIWHPWWPPHTILQSFDWYGYDERIYTYSRLGVIKGLIETELYGFSLFILGNLGTRLIGILVLLAVFIKKPHLPSAFATIVGAMALAALMTPLLFFQSGRVFEIIQMAWYYLFFCSLFAALGFSLLFSFSYPKIIKAVLFLVILLITLPSAYDILQSHYRIVAANDREDMTTPYFQTLHYLSQQETYDATVLEIPSQDTTPDKWGLNYWYNDSDASLVAFANKRSYLNNQFAVTSGIDIPSRMNTLKEMMLFARVDSSHTDFNESQEHIKTILQENNIRFIFSEYEISNFTHIKGVAEVYRNGDYRVYKVE